MYKTIYVDESGAHGFNNNTNEIDNYYVISLIIIENDYKEEFEKLYSEIIAKYHNNAILKFSTLKRIRNRDKIIADLRNLDFNFISLIVDKSKIYSDSGLIYKQSFYKYLHNIVYEKLASTFKQINFISDNYGDNNFQDSFIKYIDSKINHNELFKKINIEFKSKDPIVQFSDIIAGLTREYQIDSELELYESFKSKLLFEINFPKTYYTANINKHQLTDVIDKTHTRNDIIQNIAFKKANDLLNDRIDKNSKLLLNILLLNFFSGSGGYINRIDIIKVYDEYFNIGLNENTLKQELIPNLRSKGVLISSSKKGYKLPTNFSDINDYIEITNRNTIPAFHRLKEFLQTYSLVLGIPFEELFNNKYFELKEIYKLLNKL